MGSLILVLFSRLFLILFLAVRLPPARLLHLGCLSRACPTGRTCRTRSLLASRACTPSHNLWLFQGRLVSDAVDCGVARTRGYTRPLSYLHAADRYPVGYYSVGGLIVAALLPHALDHWRFSGDRSTFASRTCSSIWRHAADARATGHYSFND